MAIDRIGKGGGATGPQTPEVSDVGRAARPEEASRPFEVRSENAAPARAADAVDGAKSAPLDKLRAGEITVDRYLEMKVEDATAHLQGLPPAQLDEIRATLRDKLATDPALADLVKHAAGVAPPKDE